MSERNGQCKGRLYGACAYSWSGHQGDVALRCRHTSVLPRHTCATLHLPYNLAVQFTEDAGPMAHPIRPESYIKMDNFYTVTVYEKGSEVVRLYETLLGKEGFRKGGWVGGLGLRRMAGVVGDSAAGGKPLFGVQSGG